MRLIDADALMERLKEYCIDGDEQVMQWYDIMGIDEAIDNAPTIDAVPVVRCKDCVYRVIMRDPLRKPMDCYGCKVMHYNEDNWFCSFGERKDNE